MRALRMCAKGWGDTAYLFNSTVVWAIGLGTEKGFALARHVNVVDLFPCVNHAEDGPDIGEDGPVGVDVLAKPPQVDPLPKELDPPRLRL